MQRTQEATRGNVAKLQASGLAALNLCFYYRLPVLTENAIRAEKCQGLLAFTNADAGEASINLNSYFKDPDDEDDLCVEGRYGLFYHFTNVDA